MILAIDPGTKDSAFCCLNEGDLSPIRFGKIPNLAIIDEVINHEGDIVIEMIASYGMPVGKEVFETCLWIGRFIEASQDGARLIYRKDVKLHICNSPRANDAAIRTTLIDRFGAPGTKKNPGKTYGMKNDIWQAFALGVTAIETVPKEIR